MTDGAGPTPTQQQLPLPILLDRVAQSWRESGDEAEALIPKLERVIGDRMPYVRRRQAELEEAIRRLQEAARHPQIVIATTGTTSSGKSTVANVLIGDELLPSAVQEMSAGVVTIIHDDQVRRLEIDATLNAKWEIGQWDEPSADDVRKRLAEVMSKYREVLDGGAAVERPDTEPPRFTIRWPTAMGSVGAKFGLPPGAQLRILDLPGLRYVGDDINGHVVREQVKNALCLVAYNSFDTDPCRRDALLGHITEEVRALGGSPSRMLFLLNRIDAFLTDKSPVESENKFRQAITKQIREHLRVVLADFSEDIDSIEPIPFSSEPALFVTITERNSDGTAYLGRLLRHYSAILPEDFVEELPWNLRKLEAQQQHAILAHARTGSRLDKFESRLAEHITDHLPELLLPDLTNAAKSPAQDVFTVLDAAMSAYALKQNEQVKEAKRELEEINKKLIEEQNIARRITDPLKSIPPSDDLYELIKTRTDKVGEALGLKLTALHDSLHHAIVVPIRRLIDFAMDEFSAKTPKTCTSIRWAPPHCVTASPHSAKAPTKASPPKAGTCLAMMQIWPRNTWKTSLRHCRAWRPGSSSASPPSSRIESVIP